MSNQPGCGDGLGGRSEFYPALSDGRIPGSSADARASSALQGLANCRSRQDLLRVALTLAPELTRYLRRKSPGTTDAQDLMQEVYVRILKIKALQGIEQPRAYLYKVAACVAYDSRHRSAALPPHISYDEATSHDESTAGSGLEPHCPESEAAVSERLDALAARLNELSPQVRDAILWHHRDGYTCDEIAERLSAATHRVKKYLVKGLAHCRRDSPIRELA